MEADDNPLEKLGIQLDPVDSELVCSQRTKEKATACKIALESFYENFFRGLSERQERRRSLEAMMQKRRIAPGKRQKLRAALYKKESEFIRLRRQKLTGNLFRSLKIIGRGAFGEVRLVRMRGTDAIYAMKKLKKSEMIKKDQVTHVLAERNVLADHLTNKSPWVVRLFYSFQDADYLYLVMEYVPGGDMMTMLINEDTFTEAATRFYIAQTVEALDTVHQLSYIHRDIKPDNLLIDIEGHVKLSDFGLCTGLQTSRFSTLYNVLKNQNPALREDDNKPLSRKERLASWRKKRRLVAFSTVGTPDYIAPEVFMQRGYGKECDFWSVGVIMFEMLVGYPPFCSESPTETYRKIMNWRETLRFPSDAVLSPEAKDLILRLCCSAESRLGSGPDGVDEIKRHPFFKGIDWDNLRAGSGPFKPELSGPTDTRHFEEYDELPEDLAEAAAAAEAAEAASSSSSSSTAGDDLPSSSASRIDLHEVLPGSSSAGALDVDEIVDKGDADDDAAASSSSSAAPSSAASSAKAAQKRNMKASDIPWIGYTFKSFDAVQARFGIPDDMDDSFFDS